MTTQSNIEIANFKVSDISCSGCVNGISQAVTKLDGVESVEGDPNTKRVQVKYHPAKTDAKKIQTTIKEAGFDPELA